MPKPDRWRQIDQIFQSALDRDPRERPAFLDLACAGDASLGEVESLIESAVVAHSLTDLAEVLLQKGDYVSPEPMFREALAIQRKLLGNEDPSVALTLNNLASLLYQRGEYPGAESLMREVLELDRKRLGAEHPTVAYGFNNLGATPQDAGQFRGRRAFGTGSSGDPA